MSIQQKVLQLLGLAMRAGKIVTGEELVVREIQGRRAHLVILAEDVSLNTKKKVTDKCSFFNVEKHVFGSREELGHAIGKESRVVLAITDAGFASKFSEYLNEYNRR